MMTPNHFGAMSLRQCITSGCFFYFLPIRATHEFGGHKRQPVVVLVRRRSQRSRTLIVLLGAGVLLSALLYLSSSAQSACRDPDVARGFGSVAYAANVDATIQYFGHSFFLITTRKGTRIVTDPLGPGWYPNPNVADVVTVGKEMFNHNAVQIVLGN